jgi:hypothetical protein
MDLPNWLTPHTVTLQLLTGQGTQGPRYAASSSPRAMVEEKRELVRDASGSKVPSSAMVWLPLDAASSIPPGSLVTLAGDARPREVIVAARYEHSGPTPNHWEVRLK